MSEILSELIGHVMLVTISNERKRNAVDRAMEHTLLQVLKDCDERSEVRAVVVTGAGDVAFCSGHDLAEIDTPAPEGPDPCAYPAQMKKPVIAAVNGHCHAAGLLLALSCDLRVASENAVFGQPGAKLGMLPVGRQIMNLPRAMSSVHAVEMMMTSEPMTATRAQSLGFLNRLTPTGEARDEALKLASAIAANSPATVQAIKQGLRISKTGELSAFDAFEKNTSDLLAHGPDAIEGTRAFREKRSAKF
ncbi:enoyl-CoA hydratase/isomerase family protein [Mesorhizobium sp. ZC-5]|uniref:enoyl-CoA hydratase/isomerase family protein n=1 Tax=Mesorhizobium sp. ZC-5 TaxID=2986066 RepID=UPI0021E8FD31|nr:enoyl-CoA hydratase/isomerase family protein [Mesorhizobium sp. ZC-5]MCV3241756.1 enoyl-CoA hydratase/isomerase family protein [Mesorhizobium sp. ZC-5]